MVAKPQNRQIHRPSQTGLSLLETMIALTILLIATIGLLSIGMMATSTTENRGHLAARTTEYAQDKMEQLISLAWGDVTTDSTQIPMCGPSSTPACTNGTGLTIGGSSDPTAPSTGAKQLVLHTRLADFKPRDKYQADHGDSKSEDAGGRPARSSSPIHAVYTEDEPVLRSPRDAQGIDRKS